MTELNLKEKIIGKSLDSLRTAIENNKFCKITIPHHLKKGKKGFLKKKDVVLTYPTDFINEKSAKEIINSYCNNNYNYNLIEKKDGAFVVKRRD